MKLKRGTTKKGNLGNINFSKVRWKRVILFISIMLLLLYFVGSFLNEKNLVMAGAVIFEEQENSVKTTDIKSVIEITEAEHLNSNREFISNIYDKVESKDNIWSEPIYENEFIRATFEKNMTNGNVVNFYVRNNLSSDTSIEIYEKDESVVLGSTPIITETQQYDVKLTGMDGSNDVFDFKIVGSSGDYLEFDYIRDAATQKCYMAYGTNAVSVQPYLVNSTWAEANTASSVKYDNKLIDGISGWIDGVTYPLPSGAVSTQPNTTFFTSVYAEDTIITGISGNVEMEIACKIKELIDGTIETALYEVDSSGSIVYTFFAPTTASNCDTSEVQRTQTVAISQHTVSAGNRIWWNILGNPSEEIDYELKSKFGEFKGSGSGFDPTTFTTNYCGGYPTDSDIKGWNAIVWNEEVSVGGDTCNPPGSGLWEIDCNDDCVWDDPLTVYDNISITGSGTLTLNDEMDFTKLHWEIYKHDGCDFVINPGGSIH